MLDRLRASNEVTTVVPNQTREIPPVVIHDFAGGSVEGIHPGGQLPHAGRISSLSHDVMRGTIARVPLLVRSLLAGRFGQMAWWARHSWCLSQVNIPSGYDRCTGKGIRVGIIDTGIDYRHPDLRHLEQRSSAARSFVPGEPTIEDGHGHGTHCAGVVAGRPCSGVRYGVAPDAELFVAKAMNRFGKGSDDQILDAITWLEEVGVQVISMSLGWPRQLGDAPHPVYERVASDLLSRGILLIAAAGNYSDRPYVTAPVGNPAACGSILSVAALDRNGNVAPFSCGQLGSKDVPVSVSGPGVAVLASWPNACLKYVSGTSMAVPHASGIAALALESGVKSGEFLKDWMASKAWRHPNWNAFDVGRGLVQAP
jgi:subtilisin family serine protease